MVYKKIGRSYPRAVPLWEPDYSESKINFLPTFCFSVLTLFFQRFPL